MNRDELYMERCLQLAAKGKGAVSPNPMVGAILVHNDRIIGEGWHRQHGQAHAEVNCIDSVKEEDRHLIPASVMYVSLEPCAHHGKTPPCALRIIQEKIQKVVICNGDPFEQVKGRGIAMMEAEGIAVVKDVLMERGAWLNRRFFCFQKKKRPYIILKWAQTNTGIFAPADRSQLMISNRHNRQLVHKWRTEEDAIMVGYLTALHDDPLLTARLWQGKQPLRLVPDRDLALSTGCNLYNEEANTWVINQLKEERRGHLSFIKPDGWDNKLPWLMQRLHTEGIGSVIIEGGAALLNGFIEADLWDEARVFFADAELETGIAAPLLEHARPVLTTLIEEDELRVFTHRNNGYDYVTGMEL